MMLSFAKKTFYSLSLCGSLGIAALCLNIVEAKAEKVYMGGQEIEVPPEEMPEAETPAEKKTQQTEKKEPAKPEPLKLNADPCVACGMG